MGFRINDHIMELLILISACKMGSAKRITGRAFSKGGERLMSSCYAVFSLLEAK